MNFETLAKVISYRINVERPTVKAVLDGMARVVRDYVTKEDIRIRKFGRFTVTRMPGRRMPRTAWSDKPIDLGPTLWVKFKAHHKLSEDVRRKEKYGENPGRKQ